jgi:nucleoside-diphosphate-sugar epimerase
MKIAVTGATGFIGRHVIAELEQRSMTPTLVLRPSSAVSPPLAKHVVVHIDLSDPPGNAFEVMARPDVLIHLAWDGLPNYKSLHHFEEELPAQYRLLSGLVKSGLKNLVVTGTCFEYGMQSGSLRESMEARPTNPYGFAKDVLRRQLEFLRTSSPFALTWARLFYLYGEGQSASSLLQQLKRAVESGDEAFDMSGGEQLRDYLPIEEVAQHLVHLALSETDYGVVNVCSGRPVSVRKLVEGWVEENDWPIRLNLGHYPYPDFEPMAFWGDRRKLDYCLDPK